jgi:hypothetical protein
MLRRILKIVVASILFVAVTPLAASADSSEFEADLDPGQEFNPPVVIVNPRQGERFVRGP